MIEAFQTIVHTMEVIETIETIEIIETIETVGAAVCSRMFVAFLRFLQNVHSSKLRCWLQARWLQPYWR